MSKFLDLFHGKTFDKPPLWFMRQAGRYLPEYKEVRNNCATFLDLCNTPIKAAKVTLQPIERFDLDAAIVFSDILVIPDALGQRVSFVEGIGPQLSPIFFEEGLSLDLFLAKLAPVYETLHLVRSQLPKSTALIGFAGAPWTLALYMLEGEGSRDFAKAKTLAFRYEDRFSAFMDFLVVAITLHLQAQIKAGANAIQLFDTWAGLCPATHFERWVIEPTRKIVSTLRKANADLPIVGFPKGCGAQLKDYGFKTGLSGLSLDASTPLLWAVEEIPHHLVLQGNLDPLLLVTGGELLYRSILSIHEQMKERPYIFNLGHGILPQTPIKNVEDCVKWVRELRSQKQLLSFSI